MGSMQSYGAIYTQRQKIKAVAHKNDDIDGMCKWAFTAPEKLSACTALLFMRPRSFLWLKRFLNQLSTMKSFY